MLMVLNGTREAGKVIMDIMELRGGNSAEVYRVATTSIDFVWPRCLELMQTYDGGVFQFTDFDSVYQALKEDKIELWVGLRNKKIEIAGLTQVCGSKETYVELFWLGGENFSDFLEIGLQRIQQWSALIGAKNLVIGGRIGWTRRLKPFGFKFHRIEMIKPLDFIKTDVQGETSWRN